MSMINVYWTINEDAKVSIDKANAILTSKGFDTSLMKEVTDRKAVRRGIDEMQNRRVRTSNRRIVEKIRENNEVAVFGILHNVNDANIDIAAYKQDTKVVLNKNTGAVEASGEIANQVLEAIEMNRGMYNDEDIRRFCYNVIRECGGISKRPSGGIYLVPVANKGKIDALRDALTEMVDKNARIFTERIFTGEEEYQNMALSVYEDVSVRVLKVIHAAENIGKQTCRLNNHRANITNLKELTDMYKDILGNQDAMKDLEDLLVKAELVITQKIQEVSVKAST